MTKKSGVPGKTVLHLSRIARAEGRQIMREARDAAQQMAELDYRGARALRERARLRRQMAATKRAHPAPTSR